MILEIREAIDLGGGQTCDVDGVIRALDRAGYEIVRKGGMKMPHELETNQATVLTCAECGSCTWDCKADEENPDPQCTTCGYRVSQRGRWTAGKPVEHP